MVTPHTELDATVIIPFKNRASMTIDCVKSLIKYATAVKQILLVSNNSDEEELSAVREFANGQNNINVLEYNHPFNYQKINNWAAKKALGSYIVFLNNDTELREASRGLLEKMIGRASKDTVGIVGCLLLFGDEKTIQHAGVYLVPNGLAEHLYVKKRLDRAVREAANHKIPYDVLISRPLTAVTGAVQVIERKKFNSVGGFDEKFIICGGDIDLCIRLNKAGFQTWYEAGGYILHKESQSRKFTPIPFNDFYLSYRSYIRGYDMRVGDPFLPEITKEMKP